MNEIARRLAERLFDQPIIQNQYRSDFVEAMIEPYLVTTGWHHCGENWSGWDFQHSSGAKLEVKQSAAHQTWSHFLQTKAPGAFDIAARMGYYGTADAEVGLAAWTECTYLSVRLEQQIWPGNGSS